jgi:hypothetical protein
MKPKLHKRTDKIWTDESGMQIPRDRIKAFEKTSERNASKLYNEALKANKQLKKLKELFIGLCDEVYTSFQSERKLSDDNKGNFTWYNFDRSIKIEINKKEQITFDDLLIKACKEKLDGFLSDNLNSENEFIKKLVLDAFETSRGKLDTKKVMTLLKYRSTIKAPQFQDAMSLLEEAIRRPSSKSYMRIYAKDEHGEYQSIDLNFSSI